VTFPVTAIVVAGVTLAIVTGISRGFSATSAIILALIVAFGTLGIAVAGRAGSGKVSPTRCEECGGLMSPNAPYCKHCGTRVRR
jgi:hypothetical protein